MEESHFPSTGRLLGRCMGLDSSPYRAANFCSARRSTAISSPSEMSSDSVGADQGEPLDLGERPAQIAQVKEGGRRVPIEAAHLAAVALVRTHGMSSPYSESANNALQQSKLELPFAVRFWHWPTVAPSTRHTQSRGKAALDWPHLDS